MNYFCTYGRYSTHFMSCYGRFSCSKTIENRSIDSLCSSNPFYSYVTSGVLNTKFSIYYTQRFITYSRYRVVESKLKNVRARETIRYKQEKEHEGNEPRFRDVEEKIKASPGRRSMGRDKTNDGLRRTQVKKGFMDLDMVSLCYSIFLFDLLLTF